MAKLSTGLVLVVLLRAGAYGLFDIVILRYLFHHQTGVHVGHQPMCQKVDEVVVSCLAVELHPVRVALRLELPDVFTGNRYGLSSFRGVVFRLFHDNRVPRKIDR